MACRTAIRTFRSSSSLCSVLDRRYFITLPTTEATHFSETRILPYKHTSLYELIADVDNYSSFIPYCQDSRVTEWSGQDMNGRRWPAKADLKIGWGAYEEKFTSRLFCVPNSVVEALGGDAKTSLPRVHLGHHAASIDSPSTANHVFQSLSTRWTVKPLYHKPPSGQSQTHNAVYPAQTEVHLTINFQFANPFYAALSKAVAPKVAGTMIQAFEQRARRLLDGSGAITEQTNPLEPITGEQKSSSRLS